MLVGSAIVVICEVLVSLVVEVVGTVVASDVDVICDVVVG